MDAALDLLEGATVEAVSLRAVARRTGVSAMAPYRHYPDKESLLAAVAERGFDRLRGALADADGSAPSGRKLVAQGVAYVRFAMDHPVLFKLMFGPRQSKHPDLQRAGSSAFGVLLQRVGESTGSAHGPSRVLGCWSLVHGLAMLILDEQTAVAGFETPGVADIERVIGTMLLPG